ncbi:low temperature requirement protein A [Nocardioides sp. NPDC004968]|uniref:low temperature requirement protein A n=1 Tax=Nocardioides sp. NPDC004968 TaxID=3155894 RepID=UPI0033BBDCB1
MSFDPVALRSQLKHDLHHRLRPMVGRDPAERGRSVTPLELLYDLVYVVAFAAAADELAHHVSEGHVVAALTGYAFAVFALSWAWMNFTWFSSAYNNDDALFRIVTATQMIGAVVFTVGLADGFEDAVHGHIPQSDIMLIGYVIMRLPLVALWLRAAREDDERRHIAIGYASTIAAAQVLWILLAVLPLPVGLTAVGLVVLAISEMVAPVILERRLGRAPWNAGHVAERFHLLTLITLGEVVAATAAAVTALAQTDGWSLAAVTIVSSGLVLTGALWWAYSLIPSRTILEEWPDRVWLWRYAHLPIFGSIAAVGAGLRIASTAVHEEHLSVFDVAVSLAIPVGAVLLTVFLTWSVLMRAYDLSHVPLFLSTLVPLALALIIGALLGVDQPLDLSDRASLVALVSVIVLVALSAVIEVVGHELVGFSHTVRVLEADTNGLDPARSTSLSE